MKIIIHFSNILSHKIDFQRGNIKQFNYVWNVKYISCNGKLQILKPYNTITPEISISCFFMS